MRLNKIYASIKYEDLSEKDIEVLKSFGILNGYGGAGSNWLVRKLIWLICSKFKLANSQKHDYGFWIWWDIERFHECNTKFYYAMLEDAISLKWPERYFFLFIAFLSYLAVEFFWKKYFSFTEK